MHQHTKTFWTMLFFQHCGTPKFGVGSFLFQHAPVSIKIWLGEFGVEELELPAQSPDLNPTKHLWDKLLDKQSLRARISRPTSIPDLTNALLNEWVKFPAETL